MTDMEIFKWLYELKPENNEQENKIKMMMRIILSSNDNYVKEFLNTVTVEEIVDRPTKELYIKYCEWAKKNNYEKIAHNVFSEAVQNKFYVKSKTVKFKGKSTKVYKIIIQ